MLMAAIDGQAEPEAVEEDEQQARPRDRRGVRVADLAHDDEEIAGDAERERNHRGNQSAAREAMKVFRIFTPLDDAMISGWRHQQDNGQGDHREARQMYVL